MFKASRSNTPLATWTGMHKGRLILRFRRVRYRELYRLLCLYSRNK